MWLGQRAAARRPATSSTSRSPTASASASVVNGEVVRGHDNTAGEFGHVAIELRRTDLPLRRARMPRGLHLEPRDTLPLPRPRSSPPPGSAASSSSTGLTISEVSPAPAPATHARSPPSRRPPATSAPASSMVITALNPRRSSSVARSPKPGIASSRSSERSSPPCPHSAAAATPIYPEPAASFPRLRGATALVTAPMFAAPRVA